MVLPVLGALAGLVKVRYSRTLVDSQVFRLHYHWTTAFLFISCALVVASDYIGDAIQCMVGQEDAPKPITTYCWISSTFTINSTGQVMGFGTYNPKFHQRRFHAYYQWVPVVLFLQGCLFYLPHLIWKNWEGKQVDLLLQDLNKSLFDEDAAKKKVNIIKYLKDSWGLNMRYSVLYFVCEVLNLVNVVGQMFLMNLFLGGFFMKYGIKVISFLTSDDTKRNDALMETFPRMTKCIFHLFGASGEIEKKDALCVLPQNIINEKIYLVMWFWFIILTIITILQVLWQLVIFNSPTVRVRLLQRLAQENFCPRVENAIRNMHLGDFCLVLSIGKNLDIFSFRDVMQGVVEASEEAYTPSAPPLLNYRTNNLSNNPDMITRKRHIGLAADSNQ
nr:Innexin 4 [Procambarus virginalis]DAZ89883.1 TPA_exp: innexin4 [Procambarus virginalis]